MVTEVIDDLDDGVNRLVEAMTAAGPGRTVALGGAGMSTESGIPDYRGPTGRANPATPMTVQDFLGSDQARQRYWARSFIGWRRIASARPNRGHFAVAQLERGGWLDHVITQNVDGLHQQAGAERVEELHGGLNRVICMSCRTVSPRDALDRRLQAANLHISPGSVADDVIKPDGDVDIDDGVIDSFQVVDCAACGSGPLKPDVIFFGENVPPERVSFCYSLVERSKLLVVLGSSLTVASGFRFVRRAADRGIPIVIANQGPTRGDPYATTKIELPLGQLLEAAGAELADAGDAERLGSGRGGLECSLGTVGRA
ncbi:MAG: NAD-dependent protein deacetylase 1 [Frankiales bacterium]|nr:NAD-dependent protein deacetylase 1 [Frankiales bacterium]